MSGFFVEPMGAVGPSLSKKCTGGIKEFADQPTLAPNDQMHLVHRRQLRGILLCWTPHAFGISGSGL